MSLLAEFEPLVSHEPWRYRELFQEAGATCLMYAASSGNPAIVRTLLAIGANPHLVTQDDYSALDMAASIECLQLLRAATRSAA